MICLVVGIERLVRRDHTSLDKRLRRYGGRAYQLTEDEQKQAASSQVTQLLAQRVEASLSGRTFAGISATQTPTGHGQAFATLADGSVWEWDYFFAGDHWQQLLAGGALAAAAPQYR